jgi:hypothetical protein
MRVDNPRAVTDSVSENGPSDRRRGILAPLKSPTMPVELKGSCHCGAIAFTVHSSTPVPYQLCMCSICRKVGGAGGSINLGAHAHTLQITKGKSDISYELTL